MNMSRRRKARAFTFVEILAVLVVLGLIAAVFIPKIGNKMSKSKVKVASLKMSTISGAVENFNIDCDRYPYDLQELILMPEDLEGQWDGPYVNASDLEDPWGNLFVYVYPSERQDRVSRFDLISLGADGEPDGENEAADIFNE